MLRIGLTGGIGSGKSTVAKIFELLGVPVYYADAASKQLYHTHADLMAQMKQHFGEDIYSDNQLDRQRLAAIVFSDQEKLKLLNTLVHPITIQDARDWISRQKGAYVLKEAALIFESGSSTDLDYIIGVRAPQHIRIKRVMDRDQCSREEVLNRMKHQIDEDMKMRLCDFIIENNEQELVIPQVLELDKELRALNSATA
jgi:dephospho-CoA kinase